MRYHCAVHGHIHFRRLALISSAVMPFLHTSTLKCKTEKEPASTVSWCQTLLKSSKL